jgi:methionine-rich copper-binding protein CopC
VTSGPLSTLADGDGGANGVYAYGSGGFPTSGASGANYWVDVVFQPPVDTTPPTVASSTPASGATGVDVNTDPSVTFTEAVADGSTTVTVTPDSGSAVAGTLSTADAGRTVVFRPSAALSAGVGYTVTVSGAKDASGNVMAAPYSWHFTTAPAGLCPCTVFGGTVPGTAAVPDDAASAELGVRIRSDVDGWITGTRFYKGTGNTGTHTGTVWSATGQKLATGTFTQETASGWQQMSFSSPVPVTAGTDYVVSYHAPAGHYAADSGYFAAGGHDNVPLHALQDAAGAADGVYAYGSGTVFPQSSYRSTNYWVDAVFTTAATNDTTPPALMSMTPTNGATQVAPDSPIQFTFGEPIQTGSAQVSVTTSAGATIAGTVSYPTSTTVRFQPAAALPAGTGIRASISGTKDLAGNVQATAVSLSFTTAVPDASGCPCTLYAPASAPASSANETAQVELGVRFTTDTAGSVSSVRFYKVAGDTGTHTGSLWATDGTRLATATFSGETASGWQQVTFDQPVAVQAGRVYTASFHTSSGIYAYTRNAFAQAGIDRAPLHAPVATSTAPNGVYAYGASTFPVQGTTTGYGVDVVFSPTQASGTGSTGSTGSTGGSAADTTAPTVVSTSPTAGATAVPVASPVTVTFSEPVSASSVALSLTGPAGSVTGTVALDSTGTKATLTPGAALAGQTTYTVSARASDTAGNAMAAAVTSTFTTADVTAPTVTSVTPAGGATGVSSSTTVSATFSEPVVASSVTAGLAGGGATVAGTASWSADARTLTIKPGAVLSADTKYTVTVSGARDAAGNTQASAYSWSFTTASPPTTSLFTASDAPPTTAVTSTTAAELGMRVTVGQAGWVTGLRFYKGTGGTGQHVGSLWTTSGQRLAAVQFTNETATGWQVAQLSRPVAVTAGTTYVVSYTAPAGRWTQSTSYFTTAKKNGVLISPANTGSAPNGIVGNAGAFPSTGYSASNFWVDVLFDTAPPAGSSADTVAPLVVSTTPTGTGQSTRPAISALFSEQVSGVTMTLTGPGGVVVPSTVGYSTTLLTETLTPGSLLASRTTYTVTVSGAHDAAGNVLAAPVSWTFTTG